MNARRRPAGRPDRAKRVASSHASRSTLSELWRAIVRGRIAMLVCGVLAFALYVPTLSYDFARDDHDLIENNVAIRGSVELGTLLTSDFTAASGGQSGKWRPAVTLANWIDGRAGGWGSGVFHRTNLIAHALACIMLALLLTQCGLSPVSVVLAGAVFAVMPVHAESVAWISGRTDLFATVFLLVAAVFDRARWRAGGRWAGAPALICFALALLSKEVSVVAVSIVFTLHHMRTKRESPVNALRWSAPYAGVGAAWAVAWLIIVALPDVGSAGLADSAAGRAQALAMLPALLGFVLPWTLRAPDLLIPAASTATVVLGLVLHVVLLAAWAWSARRRWTLGAAIAWLWFPLLVPIGLGVWRGETVFAERLMMLPTVGVAWLVALGLAFAEPRRAGRLVQGAVGLFILVSAVETWRYAPVWRNDATLFAAVHDRQPENPIGHLGLAGVRLGEGRIDAAMELIDAAERLDPRIPEVHQYRAEIAFSRGLWVDVVLHANRTLDLDPERAYPRTLRAAAHVRADSLDAAESELEELLQTRGGDPLVASAWGELLLRRKRGVEAEPYLRFAVARQPRDPRLQSLHGMALIASGRAADARTAFERATALDPGAYEAWLSLAVLHDRAGRLDARDAALGRAQALPQAIDGRTQSLREGFATGVP